jgi:hypothetical protein
MERNKIIFNHKDKTIDLHISGFTTKGDILRTFQDDYTTTILLGDTNTDIDSEDTPQSDVPEVPMEMHVYEDPEYNSEDAVEHAERSFMELYREWIRERDLNRSE